MTEQPKPDHAGAGPPTDGDGRMPLGQILVDTGVLDAADLERVLEQQKQTHEPLGRLLVEGGYVAGHSVALALARQHGGLVKTEYGFATPPVSEVSQPGADVRRAAPPPPPVDAPQSPKPDPPLRVHPVAPPPVAAESPAPEAAAAEALQRYETLRRETAEREAAARAQLAEREAAARAQLAEREAAARAQLAELEQRLAAASATIERLDAELLVERERVAEAESKAVTVSEPAEPSDHRVYANDSHVLFVASADGYRLIERDGPPPPVDEVVELPDAAGSYRVLRLGVSPLPGARARCAYLELLSRD